MKKILSIVFGVLLLISLSAYAEGSNVAVIDIDKVLRSIPQVQVADVAFKKEFVSREATIVALQEQIATAKSAQKLGKASMTPAQLDDASAELAKDQDTLANMQAQFAQDAQMAQSKAMEKIIAQIMQTVNTIAAQKNYDLVIPKSSTVYYKNQYDITPLVISALKNTGKQ
jgi:outer membrane protein